MQKSALLLAASLTLAPAVARAECDQPAEPAIAAIGDVAAADPSARIDAAARAITVPRLVQDLRVLTKDPVISLRDATTPEYARSAEWVAEQLAAAGAQPLGDVVNGDRTFFQAFRWEDRYVRGRVDRSMNVVGVIPGTAPGPREAVLVIAHLDNLSQAEKDDYLRNEGRVLDHYEGANDNGAAVAALLAVARGIAAAGGGKRDVIFLVPSAEEDGLKGTQAWAQAPTFPLDRVVGAVNMEMIGRNSTSELLVYGGKTDADAARNPLYARALAVAARSGVTVKPGPDNDDGEGWYERSDHFVTANAGIPSIMFHGRTTEGNYHTDTDTLENLNLEKVQVTARTVLRVVGDLANDPAATEHRIAPARGLNTYSGRVWPGS